MVALAGGVLEEHRNACERVQENVHRRLVGVNVEVRHAAAEQGRDGNARPVG